MSILHHKFCGEYALELSAWGDGEVSESNLTTDLDGIFRGYAEQYGGFPHDISLLIEDTFAHGCDYGFTSVDTAFLEKLDTLAELIIPDSITEIKMTPKLENILKKNGVLIRGTFDSFAESFAKEQGLKFRHRDMFLASYTFAPAHETTSLTLQFKRDGSVQIEESVSSPGSSAGNCFGGDYYIDLPYDFFMHKSAEDIADMFGESLHNNIIKNGRLANFIEKARTHKPFMGKN